MIKYIIFDLDGVLFNGCDLHANLFIDSVLQVRPDIQLSKNYHDTVLNALSTRKKLNILNIVGDDEEKIYNIKQDMTSNYINKNITPDISKIELCKKLISLNYKLYCVTNSIRSTLDTILLKMGIINMFSGTISNQDTKEPKPSPEPYLTLYNNNNINIPNINHYTGLNDQFAVMNYDNSLIYGQRINELAEYRRNIGRIHPETYLKYIINKYNIPVNELIFNFSITKP